MSLLSTLGRLWTAPAELAKHGVLGINARTKLTPNRNPGFFAEHPRDTFGEHVWVTPFWEDDVAEVAAAFRTDRLLLGSDWPHAEGTRTPYDFVTGTLAGLPDADVDRIARTNALDLLGVAVPA